MTPKQQEKLKQTLEDFLCERDEYFLYNDIEPMLFDWKIKRARFREFEKIIGDVFSGRYKSDFEKDPVSTAKKVRDAMINGYSCLVSYYVKGETKVPRFCYKKYLYTNLRRIDTDELYAIIVQEPAPL